MSWPDGCTHVTSRKKTTRMTMKQKGKKENSERRLYNWKSGISGPAATKRREKQVIRQANHFRER